MLTDLTLHVNRDNPVLKWAKAQKNPYLAMGHVGTHLDTYNKTVIPLEYFKAPGILFDIRHTHKVTLQNIKPEIIPKGSFVIFHTGQIERFNYGDKEYFSDHPYLADEVIDVLLAKKVHFIGIDSPGICQHAEHEQTDRKCEQHGCYVIENLINVQHLPQKNFTVYTM